MGERIIRFDAQRVDDSQKYTGDIRIDKEEILFSSFLSWTLMDYNFVGLYMNIFFHFGDYDVMCYTINTFRIIYHM